MLKQTKICVSEQGSTKVSLFPCFVSWHVTYGCVSVCSLINMYDFCASQEFGIKEQSLHLGSVKDILRRSPFYTCWYLSTTFRGRSLSISNAEMSASLSPSPHPPTPAVKDFKLHSRILYQKSQLHSCIVPISSQRELACSFSLWFIHNKHKKQLLGFCLALPGILLSILIKDQLFCFLKPSDFFFLSLTKSSPHIFPPLDQQPI